MAVDDSCDELSILNAILMENKLIWPSLKSKFVCILPIERGSEFTDSKINSINPDWIVIVKSNKRIVVSRMPDAC